MCHEQVSTVLKGIYFLHECKDFLFSDWGQNNVGGRAKLNISIVFLMQLRVGSLPKYWPS